MFYIPIDEWSINKRWLKYKNWCFYMYESMWFNQTSLSPMYEPPKKRMIIQLKLLSVEEKNCFHSLSYRERKKHMCSNMRARKREKKKWAHQMVQLSLSLCISIDWSTVSYMKKKSFHSLSLAFLTTIDWYICVKR